MAFLTLMKRREAVAGVFRITMQGVANHSQEHSKIEQGFPRHCTVQGRQHMCLVLDQAPCACSRHATNLSCDGACSFRFTPTKDYFPNPAKGGSTSRQLNMAENRTPSSLTMVYQDSSRLSPSKGTASEVLSRGEESMISFNLDAPQDLNHALSLLSTSSWSSCEAKPVSLDSTNHSYHTNVPRPVMQAMTQGHPFSSEYWQNEQPSLNTTQVNVSHSLSNGSIQYQDFHLFKGPCEFGYNANN